MDFFPFPLFYSGFEASVRAVYAIFAQFSTIILTFDQFYVEVGLFLIGWWRWEAMFCWLILVNTVSDEGILAF